MIINDKTYDEERAFYGNEDIELHNCRFDGPADGESAFKEAKTIFVEDCFFNLRYPFWHSEDVMIKNCEMTSLCRAAIWYSKDIGIEGSRLHGIKALRECEHATLIGCTISSPEFGWFSKNIKMASVKAEGEYFMFNSENIELAGVSLKGKYSFQYITDSVLNHCNLDTKDAFWHAKNVVVKDSVIKGEYLGWYSENVTFENCIIEGTQPLCYCKGLKLINCRMNGADLAFEKSEVDAIITSPVISIKNPKSGNINVLQLEDLILDQPSDCVVYVRDGRE